MGVIRNQRSKIHRFELVSTVGGGGGGGGPSRKMLKVDCKVLARSGNLQSKQNCNKGQ